MNAVGVKKLQADTEGFHARLKSRSEIGTERCRRERVSEEEESGTKERKRETAELKEKPTARYKKTVSVKVQKRCTRVSCSSGGSLCPKRTAIGSLYS